ncbi:MAG: hypothetical protein GX605_13500 [Chloroflexi bacterium]|nr:hypothetical protein [Chloroflexota bacterium]
MDGLEFPARPPAPDQGDDEPMRCTVHPARETILRCNRCGRPMCLDCAVLTEVGYRCRECVRSQQSIYYNIRQQDYAVAAVISPLLGFLGALFVGSIGWLTIFLAPAAGGLIAEAVSRAARRRRGRYLWLVCSVGVAVGTLAAWWFFVRSLGGLLWLAVYAALAIGTVYGRLR